MSFKPYPKYKESGVEWLGRVPEHWTVMPLRQLARSDRDGFVDGDWIESPYITDEGIRLLQTGNIGTGCFKEQGFRYVSTDTFALLRCTEVKPSDVLICRLADPVGRACLAPDLGGPMITSVDVCIMKPARGVDPQYVVYMLSSTQYLGFMEGQCRGGTRDRVSRSFLASLRVAMPGQQEQVAIVRCLDGETAKIDALIADQQRLIELLQEKRQAVISHAVTKGLNPDAPMKDSGIDWLGEVPEHWATPPVFVRYEAVLGKMVDEKKATGSHPVPYLRNADVYWDQVNTNDLPTLDIQPHERTRFTVRKGDVLICEGGAGIGQTAIWQGEDDTTAFQKALHRLRPWDTNKEVPRYFFYCMRCAVESGRLLAGGTATIPHLTGEQLRRFRFPCPPLGEQQAIVQFLDEDGRQIDALQESATRSITLLQERRSALISAAVTGQIEVRDFAPDGGSEAA